MSERLGGLTVIDALALAVLLWQGVVGLVKGFIWQFVRLLTWLAAFAAARVGADPLGAWIARVFNGPVATSHALAWFAIFLSTLALGTGLAFLLRGVLDQLHLAAYDRLLGLVLGAAKGALIVLFAVLLASRLLPEGMARRQLRSSQTVPLVAQAVAAAAPAFPPGIRRHLARWTRSLSAPAGKPPAKKPQRPRNR